VTEIGQDLYDRLGPHQESDLDMPGQPLLALSDACIGTLQPMEDVIRDEDEGPGWSKILDPDRAPAEWLDWLSQFGGGRIPAGASEQEKRDHIKEAPAFRRGGPQSIVDAIKRVLTGTKTVYMKERDGGAYRLTIATKVSETPSEAVALNAILTQKPGGIVLTYFTVTGGDYGVLFAAHATYSAVLSGYATYADVLLDPEG
jgi:hypothetical protein